MNPHEPKREEVEKKVFAAIDSQRNGFASSQILQGIMALYDALTQPAQPVEEPPPAIDEVRYVDGKRIQFTNAGWITVKKPVEGSEEYTETEHSEVTGIKPVEATTDRESHCKDCCCAKAWEALGITSYTGKSIAEHIRELVSELASLRSAPAETLGEVEENHFAKEKRAIDEYNTDPDEAGTELLSLACSLQNANPAVKKTWAGTPFYQKKELMAQARAALRWFAQRK